MRCLKNALKPQMFIPWFSKFNLGVAVGVIFVAGIVSFRPDIECLNDSELEAFGVTESGADFDLHDARGQRVK